MSRAEHLVWLATQAFDGLAYYWPVSLALVGASVVAWVRARETRGAGRGLALSSLLFLVPIVILLWGTAFENRGPVDGESGYDWRDHGVWLLLLGHLLLAGMAVRQSRGCRGLALCVAALTTWIALWSAIVAGMSVSGDWM